SRARKHLLEDQRESVDATEHRHLLEAFVSAARTGNIASLETLLTPDSAGPAAGSGVRASR
ncbi:RNA polymerase subunit sigma-24, partial [Streptomyces sp. NPDC048211]